MIKQLGLWVGVNTPSDLNSTALRVLLLTAIFLFGYLEGAVFKRRDWACATWFWGLAALTAWIVYPLTAVHICSGTIVFVSGTVLIILFYRRKS